jgi:hypothetical protein
MAGDGAPVICPKWAMSPAEQLRIVSRNLAGLGHVMRNNDV